MDFVMRNPTIKILALAFLVLIGTMLVADSFGQHIPKGYIYFAMAFSLGVEIDDQIDDQYARTKERLAAIGSWLGDLCRAPHLQAIALQIQRRAEDSEVETREM